jgi:antirestriction protein
MQAAIRNLETGKWVWFDLEDVLDVEELEERLAEELGEGEYEVIDVDDMPFFTDLEELVDYAQGYFEHGEPWRVYVESEGVLDEAAFEEAFVGKYSTETEFVRTLLEDTGELGQIPDYLRYYIDYQALARDLFIADYWKAEHNGKIYVFRRW